MKKTLYLIPLLFLFGCGKMSVDISDSRHEVTVTLGFIDQIKEICNDLHPLADFKRDQVAQRRAVATCVLQKLTDLKLTTEELEEYQDLLDQLEQDASM